MTKPINILFMINNLYGGGAEKILQTLLTKLSEKPEYNITLYGVKNEQYNTDIYPKNVTYKSVFSGIHHSNTKNNFVIRVLNKFKNFVYEKCSPALFYKLFIKGNYDVEVAFIEGYSTRIIGGSNQKSKKIAWVHIDLHANHWTQIAYNNLQDEINSYKKFDSIVSVSKSVQDAFTKKFGIAENLHVKYNPLDEQDILQKSTAVAVTSQTETDVIKLVTVGRLENQKGYDRLLEIVKQLADLNYQFHLTIAGDGSLKETFETYIATHKLEKYVTLLGFVDNPYPYIYNADMFVCSSRSEGFSTVVSEALILGKPVIATDCSGMHELLGDSTYGLITENDTTALFEGLKQLLDDATLRAHYTSKSIERGKAFKIEKTVLEVENLWR